MLSWLLSDQKHEFTVSFVFNMIALSLSVCWCSKIELAICRRKARGGVL